MNIECPGFPGKGTPVVGEIFVRANDKVKKGEPLLNIETGKGNKTIKADRDLEVVSVLVAQGDNVSKGSLLLQVTQTLPESDFEMHQIFCPVFPGKSIATVGNIEVCEGSDIHRGDDILNIETGKGVRTVKSDVDGVVSKVCVAQGDEAKKGIVLVEVKVPVVNEVVETAPKVEETTKCEVLVIGAGPGGYVSAIYAAQNKKDVILVERGKLGGTCLNVGCIPTKALVKSSEVYDEIKNSETFGIVSSDPCVDMHKVIAHKDKVVKKLVDGIEFLMDKNEINVVRGSASFVDEKTVYVEGFGNIEYDDVIIATGSKTLMPNIAGLDSPLVLDSTKALSLETLPNSITIIGGGVIGMEFAFMYNSFGVDVHIVEYMDRLLPMLDSDASVAIEEIARKKGIDVHLNSKVTKILTSENNKAIITFESGVEQSYLVSDNILCAIGRIPNLDGLNLDSTGVAMSAKTRGIEVDDHMRTNVEHIYAIGDVNNIMQLAHVASHQGLIAVDAICGRDHLIDYRNVPNVVFTDPEIASVGITEDEARELGLDYKVSSFNFNANGKALTMEKGEGFVKLIADAKTDVILGGVIVGPDASALISILTLGVQQKMTANEYAETIFPHPTTSEVIHESVLGFGLGSIHG